MFARTVFHTSTLFPEKLYRSPSYNSTLISSLPTIFTRYAIANVHTRASVSYPFVARSMATCSRSLQVFASSTSSLFFGKHKRKSSQQPLHDDFRSIFFLQMSKFTSPRRSNSTFELKIAIKFGRRIFI